MSQERSDQNCLLVFAAVPGSDIVKPQIVEAWGRQRAEQLYRELLDNAASVVAGISHHVAFAGGGDPGELRAIFPKAESFIPQQGDSFGDRLADAFSGFFKHGCESVCAIVSDCPELDVHDITRAFTLLGNSTNAVLGRLRDGGFYLVGCDKKSLPLLSIPGFGGPGSAKEIAGAAQKHDLNIALMRVLYDVDEIGDCLRWRGAHNS
jgi:glycosyltransferase A (GT-A) superfamily protein (DUF2064 family)